MKIKIATAIFIATLGVAGYFDAQCARILNKCARYLEAKAEFEDNTDYKVSLMDINGNKVGEMEVIR